MTQTVIRMFIDDVRDPPEDGNEWVVVRSFDEFWEWMKGKKEYPGFISFDHDLGKGDMTGYDIVKNMIYKEKVTSEHLFPVNFEFYVHSQNPVGRKAIDDTLRDYFAFVRDVELFEGWS